MALTNYSFVFGSFTFGSGTPYPVNEIEGLEGAPELRVQDDNRGYNDGAFTGRDFYNGRTITMMLTILAGNGLTAQANYDLLQASLQPQQIGTQTLQFLLASGETEKQIGARVRLLRAKIDPEYTFGYIKAQVSFFCPDPRYYDNATQTLTLSAPGTVSGRSYNRTYDLSFGGGTLANYGTITNSGRVYTSPTITVSGPLINPQIGILNSDGSTSTLTVNTTLVTGDKLVFDLNSKLVTLNGSSIRNLLTTGSRWFVIPAGSSTLFFTGTGATAGVTSAIVTYRNAYI